MGVDGDTEIISSVERVIRLRYGFDAVTASRIAVGVDTANFRVVADSAEQFFAKVYRRTTALEDERDAIELSSVARGAGVPAPKVLPTLDGAAIAEDDVGPSHRGVSLHEWSTGGIQPTLDTSSAREAGAVLRRIHDLFESIPESQSASPLAKRFFATDVEELRSWYEGLRAEASRRSDDDLATRSVPLLERREELLDGLQDLMEEVRALPTQVIHGDYSRLNLLFCGSTLDAVVDFRPPNPYFPDYELARIAFDADTVALTDDWVARGIAAYEGYVGSHPPKRTSLPLGPVQWLAQLIRSDYGIRQHLFAPHPTQQPTLDRYWILRCETIERLLLNIASIRQQINAIAS